MIKFYEKANTPPLIIFVVIFAITISLGVVLFSTINNLINPDVCEDVAIEVENYCYSSIRRSVNIDVRNEGVYISRFEAVVGNEAVVISDSSLRVSGRSSLSVNLADNPGNLELLPVLRDGTTCYDNMINIRRITGC